MIPKTITSMAAEVMTTAPAQSVGEENQSLVILVTGVIVVFAALILLIAIIKIYSSIVHAAQRKCEKKPPKAPKEKNDSKVNVTAVNVTAAAPVTDSNTVDLQTIAVISAAVEAFYGEEKKVRVVSVKRTPVKRSEWAVAGMMQNISARRGF